MSIIVELPDGEEVEFPDGTADDVIERALKFETMTKRGQTPTLPGKKDTIEPYHKTDYYRMAAEGIGGAMGSFASPYLGTGLGAAAGGQIYDLTKEALGEKEPIGLMERSFTAAGDTAVNALAPRAFDNALLMGRNALKGVMSPVRNKLAGVGSKQLLQDFTDMNVRPSAGAVSGNRMVQGTEKALGGLPGSARTMQLTTENIVGDVSKAVSKTSDQFGGKLTTQELGEHIASKSKDALGRFKARTNELYENLGTYFNEGENVPVTNTLDMLQKDIEKYAKAPKLGEKFNKGIADINERILSDAESGNLPFEVLKRLRSDIGERIGNTVTAVDDLSRAQLKKLYGAVSEDLKAAAYAKGPEAQKAFDVANRYYSLNMSTTVKTIDKVLKSKTDEEVYKYAMQPSAAKLGGSRIESIRRNLKPEEWDVVTGSVINKLGTAKPGQQNVTGDAFSINSYLTNWNNLSPEAKKAIFGGTRYGDLIPELDKLTRVIASLKDVESMANPSGTAMALQYVTLIGSLGSGVTAGAIGGVGAGLGAAAAPLATTTVAPYYVAKLVTSPSFVRWLGNGIKEVAAKPNTIASHLFRLGAIAEKEPDMRNAIHEYVNAIMPTVRIGRPREDKEY